MIPYVAFDPIVIQKIDPTATTKVFVFENSDQRLRIPTLSINQLFFHFQVLALFVPTTHGMVAN
jgi:hypothetical protein